MNKYVIDKLFLLSIAVMGLLLTGCNILTPQIDRTFSPPENGRTVKITVDVPDVAELSPIEIMYRSNLCLSTKINGSREKYPTLGANYYTDTLKKENVDSLYSIELPINGGGKCDWKLSNVTLGLDLKINNHFDENISESIGSGIIIIFDNNKAQRTIGSVISKNGDFNISEHYFPWVNHLYKDNKGKTLWLYGKELYLFYKSRDAKEITWNPIIHTDAVVYSEYPAERKTKGIQRTFYYSDGTQEITNESNPNYQKLLSLIK
ncbi:hypothetical protein ACPAVH_35995 [Enterobacteriaceae bacterium TYF_5]